MESSMSAPLMIGRRMSCSATLRLLVPVQWDEPFGIVFAEALACGTPIISCPRGALPEIVREGVEGFLCDTAEQLVNAIHRTSGLDRGACRRRAEEAFSTEAVLALYEALYDEITPSRSPAFR
jgi:glycosyltransferase involved in cell wall biosynthesis